MHVVKGGVAVLALTLGLSVFIPSKTAFAACSAPGGKEGEIFYNATQKIFQYCNDTNWVPMNAPGSGAGGCSTPTLAEGKIVYNATQRLMQGCAGNVHRAFGPAGGTNPWKQISLGAFHGCAIKQDNRLYCFGTASNGQTGVGPLPGTVPLPREVDGGGSWKMVSGGWISTCGIKSDDTLWCWGSDNSGQLGNGATTDDQFSPVAISGGGSWKYISVGGSSGGANSSHACGIKSDDSLWCWGGDSQGQLGNGAVAGQQNAPYAVPGGASWKAVSAGSLHTCGIQADDSLWCWGANLSGQLGNGNTTAQNAPVQISAGTFWSRISAGGSHTCGILTSGTANCWGRDTSGQVGNNAAFTASLTSPTALSGGGTWLSISASLTDTSCGMRNDYSIQCWGLNTSGQIGDNTVVNKGVPTALSGGGSWSAISTGTLSTCGLRSDGEMRCWGNKNSLPVNFPSLYAFAPMEIAGDYDWKMISSSDLHSCGIQADSTLWCWGTDTNGQLGNGAADSTFKYAPVSVSGGGSWIYVDVGGRSSCGIKSDNTLWCWGDDTNAQLGNGATTGNIHLPAQISGGGSWKTISLSESHACGIKSDDTLWCWGDDTSGQLGNGATSSVQNAPVQIAAGTFWKDVTTARRFFSPFVNSSMTCGIQTDNTLWCWGNDAYGQLGTAASQSEDTPASVTGGGSWQKTRASVSAACGLQGNGTLWCWGNSTAGIVSTTPVEFTPGQTWRDFDIGPASVCATTLSGILHCAGLNTAGVLGIGSNVTSASMTPVAGPDAWSNVSVQNISSDLVVTVGLTIRFSCGVLSTGKGMCWGAKSHAGIDLDPTLSATNLPAPVANTACSDPVADNGALRYNSTHKKLQYCVSPSWVQIGL